MPTSAVYLAVVFLGFIALMTVFSCALIIVNEKEVPDGLIAIGSGCIGSLGTFLASNYNRKE